jgi:hypothetical protein
LYLTLPAELSRDEWTVMAAIAEFARRAGPGVEGEFAADELARSTATTPATWPPPQPDTPAPAGVSPP